MEIQWWHILKTGVKKFKHLKYLNKYDFSIQSF